MPKLLLAIAIVSLTACSRFPGVYKIPVEQGNQVSQADVDAIEIGMSREQVRFLIGTPIFINRLENDRWIYVRRQTLGDTTLESSNSRSVFKVMLSSIFAKSSEPFSPDPDKAWALS